MRVLVVPRRSGWEISDTKIGAETRLLPALCPVANLFKRTRNLVFTSCREEPSNEEKDCGWGEANQEKAWWNQVFKRFCQSGLTTIGLVELVTMGNIGLS